MDLTDLQRRYLRTLWEETGGEMDTVHDFWREVRRRGLRMSLPKVSFFLRTLRITAEVRRELEELWADHQSSADDLLRRAKDEKIAVTAEQVSKFVREQPSRESERFLEPPRDGKSFAYDPRSEWKMDVVYMPASDGFKYILLRINSFTRELDGVAVKDLTSTAMKNAVLELLGDHKPRVVLTDGGPEFAACRDVFERRNIYHEVKEQGDYGAFSILDGAIGKLKRMLRIEGVEKDRTWHDQLSRVLRILNARPNKQLGVSPASVTVDDTPSAKEKDTAELGQFWIYKHMSQNILHNIDLSRKKAAVLAEKGGARIRLPKSVEENEDPKDARRRGPKRRADDPKFGATERLLNTTFKDGRVYTESGKSTNMKLVVPSVPPKPHRAGVGLSVVQRGHMRSFFAWLLNEGPQTIREAHRFLKETGDMSALLTKYTFRQALQSLDDAIQVKDDIVFIDGECVRDGVRFRVQQRPEVRRFVNPEIEFLGSERLSKLSLEMLVDLDRRYFDSVEKDPPERYDLVQRMIRWSYKVKSDEEVLDIVGRFDSDFDEDHRNGGCFDRTCDQRFSTRPRAMATTADATGVGTGLAN